jgi:hypothetical protein
MAGILRLIALFRLELTKLSTKRAFLTFLTIELGFILTTDGLLLLYALGLGDLFFRADLGLLDLGLGD